MCFVVSYTHILIHRTTHQDVFIATQHTLQRNSSLATIVVNNQSKSRCPVAGHSMAYNSVDHDRQFKQEALLLQRNRATRYVS